MTLQYQLTPEDFIEASATVSMNNARARVGSQAMLYVWLASFIIYFAFTLWLCDGVRRGANFSVWLTHSAVVFIAVAVYAIGYNIATFFRHKNRQRLLLQIPITLIAAGLIAIMFLVRRDPPPGETPPSGWAIIVPHLTWLYILLLILALSIIGQSHRARRSWLGQPALHRPKTTQITIDGISVRDVVTLADYQWPAFTRLEETRNLFLLYLGDSNFVIIPKRAFESPEMMDALRAMARAITAQDAPRGFAVAPAAKDNPASA